MNLNRFFGSICHWVETATGEGGSLERIVLPHEDVDLVAGCWVKNVKRGARAERFADAVGADIELRRRERGQELIFSTGERFNRQVHVACHPIRSVDRTGDRAADGISDTEPFECAKSQPENRLVFLIDGFHELLWDRYRTRPAEERFNPVRLNLGERDTRVPLTHAGRVERTRHPVVVAQILPLPRWRHPAVRFVHQPLDFGRSVVHSRRHCLPSCSSPPRCLSSSSSSSSSPSSWWCSCGRGVGSKSGSISCIKNVARWRRSSKL